MPDQQWKPAPQHARGVERGVQAQVLGHVIANVISETTTYRPMA